MKKRLIILVVTLIIPALVALGAGYLWQFPFLLVSGICYAFLALILTPFDSFLSTSADFKIKQINPHYQPPAKVQKKIPYFDLVRFVLLIALTGVCLFSYLQYF